MTPLSWLDPLPSVSLRILMAWPFKNGGDEPAAALKKARAGDRAAFEGLVRSTQRQVFGLARALGARLTFSDPNHNHIFNLALGLLIISGLTALPYVGWLILLPLGLGAPILAWLGRFGAAR